LLEGIFGRRRSLYKQAAEFSHDQSPEVYARIAGRPYHQTAALATRVAERLSRTQGIPLQATELLIDAPPPHREVEFAIDVYFPKEKAYRPLREVSPVVEALATTQFDDWVKRVRVFVAPRWRPQMAAVCWHEELLAALQ
jgi:hypothetical protein